MRNSFKLCLLLPFLLSATLYQDRFANSGGSSSTFQPSVDFLASGDIVVCFDFELTNVECEIYSPNGEFLQTLSLSAGYANIYPYVNALADGGFVINFEASSNTEAVIYNSDFSVRTPSFQSVAGSRTSVISFSDSSFVLAYTDSTLAMQATKYSSTGSAIWSAVTLFPNIEYGKYGFSTPNTAANDGSFYVTVLANGNIPSVGYFSSSGSQIATYSLPGTGTSNVYGKVTPSGNFLAVWSTSAGINAELLSSSLSSLSSTKLLVSGSPTIASVGVFSDDSFFVAFISGTNGELQIYNSDFTTKVSAFTASSFSVTVERFIGAKITGKDQVIAIGMQDGSGEVPGLQKFDSSGNDLCFKTDGNGNCYSCFSNNTCPLSSQTCTASTGLCGCTSSSQCPTGTPFCNTTTGSCYQCTNNSECANSEICSTLNVCSACSSNTECQLAGLGTMCVSGRCTDTPTTGGCKQNSDCGIDLLCNKENGECYPGLPTGFTSTIEASNIAMMSAAGTLMLASANPGFGFSIISLFQQFFYLCFLNTPYPNNLARYYEMFELGILNFFPNLVKPPNAEKAELYLPSPPNLFEHNHPGYFFSTGGTGLSVMLIVLGAYIFVKTIQKVVAKKEGKMKEKVAKLVDLLEWGGLVRIWLAFSMPIIYASVLQLYAARFDKTLFTLASLVSIFYIIFALIFIYLAFRIAKTTHDPKKYPFLHAEYKKSTQPLIMYAGILFYARRIVEPLIIVICYWVPGIQVTLLFFISMYFSIYQITQKPFEDGVQNITMVVNDIALSVVYALNLSMIGNSPDSNTNLGEAIIVILTAVISFSLVMTIVKAIKGIRDKKKKAKENQNSQEQEKVTEANAEKESERETIENKVSADVSSAHENHEKEVVTLDIDLPSMPHVFRHNSLTRDLGPIVIASLIVTKDETDNKDSLPRNSSNEDNEKKLDLSNESMHKTHSLYEGINVDPILYQMQIL